MPPYRLGLPVKVLGAGLRPHDSRRWQNAPHLSVSLAYLRDLFAYLDQCNIRVYRLSGQLAPYSTHPQLPQFHHQIDECADELAATGELARHYGLRLTLHPAHYVQLNSHDPATVRRAIEELGMAARLLDALGLGAEACIVVHVGGAWGDTTAGRARFVNTYAALPHAVAARLALEHDHRAYSFADALWIHRRTGIRLVLDTLHHRCLNPTGLPLEEALRLALETWPPGEQPKIHFSSPRTELRRLHRNGAWHLQLPLAHQHSDFIHPFEFIEFLAAAVRAGMRPFDIMLEAKAKEYAVLHLRNQVARFAPDLAPLLG